MYFLHGHETRWVLQDKPLISVAYEKGRLILSMQYVTHMHMHGSYESESMQYI